MDELLTLEQVEELPDGDYYLEEHCFIRTVDSKVFYEILYKPLKCEDNLDAIN